MFTILINGGRRMDYSSSYYQYSIIDNTGFYICILAFTVINCIFLWKIFAKAGIPGWWALIPFANYYKSFELFWDRGKGWMFILMFIPIANIVVSIMLCLRMAKSFGKGAGFGVGLIFLSTIFYAILAFGNASYIGPNGIPLEENI